MENTNLNTYLQIGITAMRAIDGTILKSVPLFALQNDLQNARLAPTSPAQIENAASDVSGLFIDNVTAKSLLREVNNFNKKIIDVSVRNK